jgi:hypothetical protein
LDALLLYRYIDHLADEAEILSELFAHEPAVGNYHYYQDVLEIQKRMNKLRAGYSKELRTIVKEEDA